MKSRGFTLIELVVVLVIFGIVAAMGSGYVVSSVTAYNQAAERNKLVARSQALVERMARQLRIALPYSVRVSTTGNCIEFMQITGGSSYLGQLPDSSNGMAATNVINTAPFALALGNAVHAAVGALAPSEIYINAATSSRAAIASVSATQINLTANHIFNRNSINERVYVTDAPARFCFAGSQLWHYSGYPLDTNATLGDGDPGGGSLLSDDVVQVGGANVFSLSAATESRNALVTIAFGISRANETVEVNHQVQIRNVP